MSADLFGWRDQTDAAEIGLFFFDSLLQVTDGPSLDGNANYDGFWESALTAGSADTFQTVSGTVPVDALFLVVRITSTRDAGSSNDGYADNVFLGLHAATGPTLIEGTNDNDRLEGTPFDDVIQALEDHDEIIGSVGNDVIYGDEGDDTLDYSSFTGDLSTLGRDRIKDWEDGVDTLNFNQNSLGWTEFDDVLAAARVTGGTNLRIDFDADNFVVIENFALTDFTSDDVSFNDLLF